MSGREERMDDPLTSSPSSSMAAMAAEASAVTWATTADALATAGAAGSADGPEDAVAAVGACAGLAGATVAAPELPGPPEGAEEVLTWALPAAVALPAGPPVDAAPRTALFDAVGLEVSAPVVPVGPVSPLETTGVLRACDVASPVSPVLVEPELAVAAPELPVVADGLTETLELPPAPPPADPAPVDEPPLPLV